MSYRQTASMLATNGWFCKKKHIFVTNGKLGSHPINDQQWGFQKNVNDT